MSSSCTPIQDLIHHRWTSTSVKPHHDRERQSTFTCSIPLTMWFVITGLGKLSTLRSVNPSPRRPSPPGSITVHDGPRSDLGRYESSMLMSKSSWIHPNSSVFYQDFWVIGTARGDSSGGTAAEKNSFMVSLERRNKRYFFKGKFELNVDFCYGITLGVNISTNSRIQISIKFKCIAKNPHSRFLFVLNR